ncbi:MAG: MBL fold metallo-hydrolase [Candidatus Promineifilaceae bacterium]|nr:MBL fold metallo-hydrolase [Candidatus Promineifilaceae bacterium]
MKIKWLAHASFLIEGDGLRIITDPYEPNDVINLPPVTESADIVVRSSDDDEAHCFIGTIPSGFELVTATDIVDTGAEAKGVRFSAIWSEESHIYKEVVRDNAMYRFTLEGIHITHLGDVGNALTNGQTDALLGTDILLALVGGPPTIELDDLHEVIERIQPKVVIPMHYRIPGPRFFMLPVTDFTDHYPDEKIIWSDRSEVEFSKDSLPDEMTIMVLKPTLFREEHD